MHSSLPKSHTAMYRSVVLPLLTLKCLWRMGYNCHGVLTFILIHFATFSLLSCCSDVLLYTSLCVSLSSVFLLFPFWPVYFYSSFTLHWEIQPFLSNVSRLSHTIHFPPLVKYFIGGGWSRNGAVQSSPRRSMGRVRDETLSPSDSILEARRKRTGVVSAKVGCASLRFGCLILEETEYMQRCGGPVARTESR